jgi:hypothetical protein
MKLVTLTKMCLNETYGEVCVGKHLSHNFLIHNVVKEGDGLSPLLFNFPLEYDICKVQEIRVGLKLNGTHQVLVYPVDVNLLEHNIGTVKKKRETLIDGSKEVGLEVHTEKTKYMLLSRH